MRKIREVLRLTFEQGLTQRLVSQSTGVSKGSITDYLSRARREGVSWEVAQQLNDDELEMRLFAQRGRGGHHGGERVAIDLEWIHREIRRPSMTLQQLWLEYRNAARAQGKLAYQYTHFCVQYRQFRKKVDLTMRQEHRAGEKAFVDYSGKKPLMFNRETGEYVEVELFVGVLGASNYTFAEATFTQSLSDFVGSTIRMFEFFGGVPQIVVPDQLRSAVSGPDRYDPEINPTYAEMAQHYGVAIIPARPRKPRDKAKVEVAVQVVQRWILASLRNRKFFSLEELNVAIRELLHVLNQRPFQKLPGSRKTLFESLDRPALRCLPVRRYEIGEWKKARVNIDYHFEYDSRLYSVPYQMAQQSIELRASRTTIEVFHCGQRIVSHMRSYAPKGTATTLPEHRPKSHQQYGAWPPSRLVNWAASVGPSVALVVERILADKPHPEMGYRSCMALIRAAKTYPAERVDAACAKALAVGSPSRKTVLMILQRGLDRVESENSPIPATVLHDNVRGGAYYDRKEQV